MVGRFLCGLAIGCYCFIVPVYIGEISTNEMRGTLLSIFQVALNCGILFVFTVGHFSSLRVVNIVCGCIPILYSICFLALPESPSLLIRKERDARKVLRKLRGKSNDNETEINALKAENENLQSQRKSPVEVFNTKSTRKAFIILMFQFTFFQMTGINVVSFYSTMIFTAAGIHMEPGIASIIVASAQVATNLVALAFVDRFGRKILLYISIVFMCLGLIGIGFFFTQSEAGKNVDNLEWLPVLSLSIFVIAFCIGMGPVTFILSGELFMQDAKVFVAPISQMFNFLLTFACGLTFPMLVQAIGMGPTFFIFAGFCVFALLFTIFVIPETKGKSTAEIQEILS